MSTPHFTYSHRLWMALVICGALAACHRNNEQPTESDEPEELVIYSGRGENLVGPVIEAFERETGVRVRVSYADTSQLAATLLEEGEASPADIFFAQDASTLALLESEGVFERLPEAILSRVAGGFRSPGGYWVGTTGRARVLAYNSERVAPEALPASLHDLAQPVWRGRVGWAPENASFQSFVGAMLQLEGLEQTAQWLAAMQANAPRAYPNNTTAVLAVSTGEVDVALTNHYYLHRLQDEHGADFPVRNHYFRNGNAASFVSVSGAALIAGAENQGAAERFLTFLLSEAQQQYFATANYEFPLVEGVERSEALPGIATLNPPAVRLAELSDLETTVRLLRDVGALP